jgi:hypothetical protein
MSSYTSISSDKLSRLIGTPHAPVLVDVRLDDHKAPGQEPTPGGPNNAQHASDRDFHFGGFV